MDTLSSYGDDVVHLGDRADRRTLLAAPRAGTWSGPLGAGESLTSSVSGGVWSLRFSATRARTYDVRATLTDLDQGWKPCSVEAGGKRVSFHYDAARRVLAFSADVAATGAVQVTACRR